MPDNRDALEAIDQHHANDRREPMTTDPYPNPERRRLRDVPDDWEVQINHGRWVRRDEMLGSWIMDTWVTCHAAPPHTVTVELTEDDARAWVLGSGLIGSSGRLADACRAALGEDQRLVVTEPHPIPGTDLVWPVGTVLVQNGAEFRAGLPGDRYHGRRFVISASKVDMSKVRPTTVGSTNER